MNRPSVALTDVKGGERGDQALTKRFNVFNPHLVLGPVIPRTFKMAVVPACMVLA